MEPAGESSRLDMAASMGSQYSGNWKGDPTNSGGSQYSGNCVGDPSILGSRYSGNCLGEPMMSAVLRVNILAVAIVN